MKLKWLVKGMFSMKSVAAGAKKCWGGGVHTN